VKNIFIAASILLCAACAKPSAPDLLFSGSENRFSTTEKRAWGGIEAIENSFVISGGELMAFFDPAATGEMRKRSMASGQTRSVLPGNARFSYVIAEMGELHNFVTISGRIHRMRSSDHGETWSDPIEIQAAPMVQWNPGVVKDGNGLWHMLIEASETGVGPLQGNVGCYYYTSADGDAWISHGRVIDKCGNPWLAATSRGLLVIHGDLKPGYWQTTASTFDGSTWETHRDKWLIHSPGVHVCDPHAIEIDGRIILSVSVDQNSITLTEAADGLESLHQRLR
jgi:hypothetical protein